MHLALPEPLAPEDFAAAVDRLVLTRWIAAGLVVALTLACPALFGVPLPVAPLLALGAALAGYNVVLAVLAGLLRHTGATGDGALAQWPRRLMVAQVALDWLAMTAFVHLTGGITSPAIPLYVIHVLMVAVLSPSPSPYLYVALASAALAGLAGLESLGVLAHHLVLPLPADLHHDPRLVAAQVGFFAFAALTSVHMTRLVVERLRERDRQLAALLGTTRAAASSLDLQEVLDHLVESAAHALAAKAAAIRLLDESSERLEVIASTGLSERFLNRGFSGGMASRTDREALSGAQVIVSDALSDPRIQCREEVALEGIGSVLVVPVKGRRGPLGVLRVYSGRPSAFEREDLAFAQSIAAQGAAAIENALAHDALQKSESTRGQFVRMVTHELRAPLAGALSLLHVVVDGLAGDLPAEPRALLVRVGVRLRSLSDLVNDLLALAASKTAGLQEQTVQLDLTSSVRRVVENLSSEGTAKGVSLSLETPDAPLVVQATEQGLARIFGNLVGNALKYTPCGGRVTVRVAAMGASVEASIADTGIGIPEADLPGLFGEFFRAGNARSSEITGTGLGLAIVKRLVDGYRGTIGVRSKVGQGTTFTVTLPLVAPSDVSTA